MNNITDRILKKIKDGQEVKISSFDGDLALTVIGAIRNREIISRTPILAVHTEQFPRYLIKEISQGPTFFVVKSETCYFLIHQKHIKVMGEDLNNLISWVLEYIHEIGRFEKSDPQLLLKMAVDEGSLVILAFY